MRAGVLSFSPTAPQGLAPSPFTTAWLAVFSLVHPDGPIDPIHMQCPFLCGPEVEWVGRVLFSARYKIHHYPIPREPCYQVAGEDTVKAGVPATTLPRNLRLLLRLTAEQKHLFSLRKMLLLCLYRIVLPPE